MSDERSVLLAFDYGLKRIGIASANLLTRTAHPVTTLNVGTRLPWNELDRIVDEWRPDLFVVGLPTEPGSATTTRAITHFVARLGERYGLKVATVDESLTSHAAHAELRESRRSGFLRRKIGRARLDRHAACLIAEQWMSEHHAE